MMPVDVAMTVTGSKKMAEAIAESPATLGHEATETPVPEHLSVGFVDYPFRDDRPDLTPDEYVAHVAETEPRIVVAPDLEPGDDPAAVYALADRLAEHAGAVVLVTKHPDVHPEDVPDRFRVGVPMAGGEFSGATPWRLIDYRDAGPLHLLGGSPEAHREADRYVTVASVDTSSPQRAAEFGAFWTRDGWRKLPDGETAPYALVKASLSNMVAWWRDRRGGTPVREWNAATVAEHAPTIGTDAARVADDPSEALGYGRPATVREAETDLWREGDQLPDETPEPLKRAATTEVASIREQARDARFADD